MDCVSPNFKGRFVAENPGDLAGMEAHCGMLKAARYVFAELREKNILNKAFSYFDGYTVSELDIYYEYNTIHFTCFLAGGGPKSVWFGRLDVSSRNLEFKN